MEIVTVSPKYQVVLPKMARNALGVKVGQKMIVFAYDRRCLEYLGVKVLQIKLCHCKS